MTRDELRRQARQTLDDVLLVLRDSDNPDDIEEARGKLLAVADLLEDLRDRCEARRVAAGVAEIDDHEDAMKAALARGDDVAAARYKEQMEEHLPHTKHRWGWDLSRCCEPEK